MSDNTEIFAVLERYRKALHDKDAAAAVALLNDNVTLFALAPPLAIRGEAARDPDGIQQWFDTWDGPITVETPDWTIYASGDCGFAYGLTQMRGTKADGD